MFLASDVLPKGVNPLESSGGSAFICTLITTFYHHFTILWNLSSGDFNMLAVRIFGIWNNYKCIKGGYNEEGDSLFTDSYGKYEG